MDLRDEPFWDELVARKDEMSVRELAATYGTTPGVLSLAFKQAGITKRPQARPADADDGSVVRPGSKDALIEAVRDQLGKVPDSTVADAVGVSTRTVASFRKRHAIDAYKGRSPDKKPRKRRSRIDPFVDIVGTVPDRVVAEKAGVTINAVRNFRTARGIPSARSTRSQRVQEAAAPTRPAPAPVAAQAPVAVVRPAAVISMSGSALAFQITFADDKVRYVVASDMSSAANRAQEAGTPVRIECLGTALVG